MSLQLLNIIFPDVITNDYQGNPNVIWVFGIFSIISVIRSLIHIFKYDDGAQSIGKNHLTKFLVTKIMSKIIKLFMERRLPIS